MDGAGTLETRNMAHLQQTARQSWISPAKIVISLIKTYWNMRFDMIEDTWLRGRMFFSNSPTFFSSWPHDQESLAGPESDVSSWIFHNGLPIFIRTHGWMLLICTVNFFWFLQLWRNKFPARYFVLHHYRFRFKHLFAMYMHVEVSWNGRTPKSSI